MYQDFRYTLAHAQTVCTRPSFRARGPGDEASHYRLDVDDECAGESSTVANF